MKKDKNPLPAPADGLAGLEKKVGVAFRNRGLLREALTHSSRANEDPSPSAGDNERLEFLGDAVLGLAAACWLSELFPDAPEGELTKMRAVMVREEWLAGAGLALGLEGHLLLGRGEELSGGRNKPSILAGAVEALAGAVFLDRGWPAAYRLAARIFPPPGEAAALLGPAADSKTALQEICQEKFRDTPRYEVLSRSGPDHRPRFSVSVSLGGETLAEGEGASKKEAEQAAAAKALPLLRRRRKG